MKEITYKSTFGREIIYYYTFELETDIKIIEKIIESLGDQHILSYCGMKTITIYNLENQDNFIWPDLLKWIIFKWHNSEVPDIRKRILELSIEDSEWTKERNKDLTGIFYRKIRFLPKVIEEMNDQLQKMKKDLEKIYSQEIEIEEREKKEREGRYSRYAVVKEYRYIKPTFGEQGRDGYYDADYKSEVTGEIIRFVTRDVFDFGCYSYPKRYEGTKAVLNQVNWTEEEVLLSKWINEFGKFSGIRM